MGITSVLPTRLFLPLFLLLAPLTAQELTEVIVDSAWYHAFVPRAEGRGTRVLIDRHHDTIYRTDGPDHGAHVLLDIMRRDGFETTWLDTSLSLPRLNGDILIIHGLPNDVDSLGEGADFWKSPLSDAEVEAVARFVANGGGLFLTLSHFPNGSGARPLLEAFQVRFRDGYAFHPDHPSFHDPGDKCSHFFGMSPDNGLLNPAHPLLAMGPPVRRVDFLCGAIVFRRPEDVIIPFPAGTRNYNRDETIWEESDVYAAMIAFPYGRGRVVICTDQGMFRNFIFTFDHTKTVHVTITSPENDNANLFVNLMRWLAPPSAR